MNLHEKRWWNVVIGGTRIHLYGPRSTIVGKAYQRYMQERDPAETKPSPDNVRVERGS